MCPVQVKKLLIIRPKVPNDFWTMYTSVASEHLKGYAEIFGWTVTELEDGLRSPEANRIEVAFRIQNETPDLVIHYGHGWPDRLWGQRNNMKESVLSSAFGEENVNLLSSSSVSTVSCFSILDLGKRAVEANTGNKKTYYLGYDIPIYCNYDEKYLQYFERAANAANDALIEGKTFQDARDIGYNKYTEESNKLHALKDPYVDAFVTPLLLLNRDHLKLLQSKRSPTLAARVPAFGNSIIVKYYLRKLRDKFFSRKAHERLHPLI
jgi:hypothetical protein